MTTEQSVLCPGSETPASAKGSGVRPGRGVLVPSLGPPGSCDLGMGLPGTTPDLNHRSASVSDGQYLGLVLRVYLLT